MSALWRLSTACSAPRTARSACWFRVSIAFRLGEFTQTDPYLRADITLCQRNVEDGLEIEALARNAREQFGHIAEMIPSFPRELVGSIQSIEDPLQTVYTIANFQRMDLADAQTILELDSVTAKLHKLVAILTRESEVLELGQKIQNEARSEIEKMQREYFLREQLKAIQRELGENDEQAADVEEFRKKIDAAGLSEEADKASPARTRPSITPAHGCRRIRGHPHLSRLAGNHPLVKIHRRIIWISRMPAQF